MHCLVALLVLLAPADEAKMESRLLEDVLDAKEKPSEEKPIMVHTRILVHYVDRKKKVLSVKFADAQNSPNVNIKIWDRKLHELKPETTIRVTGTLHFGKAPSGAPSIRYKVREQSGRVYNDHRHWRTDRAIYILNPSYEIVEEKNAEKKDEAVKGAEEKEEKK
jgi:hypothetical protein